MRKKLAAVAAIFALAALVWVCHSLGLLLERTIIKENEIKEIEKEMQKEEISSDYLKLNELQETKQKLNKEIEKKMNEWEELNENL